MRLVLFDLLYHRGRSLLAEPFRVRHERLAELCATLAVAELALADGVIGPGRAFFAAAIAAGHEGVVAKRLDASYRPGHRSPLGERSNHATSRNGLPEPKRDAAPCAI